MVESVLDGLRITRVVSAITYVAPQSRYPMYNQGRASFGLLCTVKGTEIFTFADKTVRACPGSVLIIPKGEAYGIALDDPESVVDVVDFEADFSMRPLFFHPEDSGVRNAVAGIFAEWRRDVPGREAWLLSQMYKIVALIQKSAAHGGAGQAKRIAPSVAYLREHCADADFGIEKAAALSGMGRRYFEKLFAACYGASPHAYVIRLKTERAMELLRNGKNRVSDVAGVLGYGDVCHFSKQFKQNTGVSPREFRRSVMP